MGSSAWKRSSTKCCDRGHQNEVAGKKGSLSSLLHTVQIRGGTKNKTPGFNSR